jgi:hypothetical protein
MMQLKIREVDKLAAVAPGHVLGALGVSDRVSRGHHLPAVFTVYEKRLFIGYRHSSIPQTIW